ncbi:MAG TPA: F0F1 ATP synthase subunit gamma [Myxococcales bacterium]
MEDLGHLQARLASIGELLEIVGAMRSLAAARMQQAQQALEGVRRYQQVVADAIASALPLVAETAGPTPRRSEPGWLIVFCSQHGFAGPFNERMLDAAQSVLAGEGGRLCIVGARGALRADERRLEVPWSQPMATQVGGVLETARKLEAELYRRLEAGEAARVEVLFSSPEPDGRLAQHRISLLPLALEAFAAKTSRVAPLHNLPARPLAEKLIAEYVFAGLVRAAMGSLLGENASRLRAMEVAHQNIADKQQELRQLEREAQQEQTTSEMLDVVTGAEALLRGRPR